MRVRSLRLLLLPLFRRALCLGLLLGATSASALSITPPPGSPLLPDDGSEAYCPCDQDPNPLVTRNVVLLREGYDPISASIPHEWGIYFLEDPDTLIPVFTSEDTPAPGPLNPRAAIDFNNGRVVDLDTMTVEYSFTPTLCCFGFYLKIEGQDPVLTYSQATLNDGGVDTFASFPHMTQANFRVVAFEIDEQVLSIDTVNGACVIPEPSVALLVGSGLALMAGRRRRPI